MIGPKSARLSIVIPAAVDQRLRAAADQQGRSISNLAARMICDALRDEGAPGDGGRNG
ncbi:hypothetical protein EBT31_14720 [bacterium]|nr:hypothetical protein [bacterium]